MRNNLLFSQYPLDQRPVATVQQSRLCEACEQVQESTYYCVNCDMVFCITCWAKQGPHKPGKVGPDGLPHEKADPQVVKRLQDILTPSNDPVVQQFKHQEDEDTTWFGVTRDTQQLPIFQDYGRYTTIMVNSAIGQHRTRYPHLVSFIGQTGAGKSTLIKMLIDNQECNADPAGPPSFPSPVVGSVRNDNTPTSGDVHLYSDPASYLGAYPMLYADCEGLEGGENIPMGLRHREQGQVENRARSKSHSEVPSNKRRHRIGRGTQRGISWANSPETQKRQYAVTELYPRLLFTFSDVIVFVLRNPK